MSAGTGSPGGASANYAAGTKYAGANRKKAKHAAQKEAQKENNEKARNAAASEVRPGDKHEKKQSQLPSSEDEVGRRLGDYVTANHDIISRPHEAKLMYVCVICSN